MESISISELGEVHLPCPDIKTQQKCLDIFREYEKKSYEIKNKTDTLREDLMKIESNFEDNLVKKIKED